VARATFTRRNLVGVFVGPTTAKSRRELERAVGAAEVPDA
jgi:hypothetical protein